MIVQQAAQLVQHAASMAQNAAEISQQAAKMAEQAARLSSMTPAGQLVIGNQNGSDTAAMRTPIQAQPPHPLDQPMENYRSQFPVSAGGQRNRKKRATPQQASGGSRSAVATALNPAPLSTELNPSFIDFQRQLMLLEAQKKQMERLEAFLLQDQGNGEGSTRWAT